MMSSAMIGGQCFVLLSSFLSFCSYFGDIIKLTIYERIFLKAESTCFSLYINKSRSQIFEHHILCNKTAVIKSLKYVFIDCHDLIYDL